MEISEHFQSTLILSKNELYIYGNDAIFDVVYSN